MYYDLQWHITDHLERKSIHSTDWIPLKVTPQIKYLPYSVGEEVFMLTAPKFNHHKGWYTIIGAYTEYKVDKLWRPIPSSWIGWPGSSWYETLIRQYDFNEWYDNEYAIENYYTIRDSDWDEYNIRYDWYMADLFGREERSDETIKNYYN